MEIENRPAFFEYMMQFITENKKTKFKNIIDFRTRHITVVLEDIYQSHNASAVLRTCDCFGVQDVHIIENRNKYNINKDVEMGSSKWLNIIEYDKHQQNTLYAFDQLRKNGYRIVATSPHKNEQLLEQLPINGKIALVFGTELDGLSEVAMNHVDEFVKIPMYGFTESFNVSVSAAILLANLTDRIRKSDISWQLSDEEKAEVLFTWAWNTVKNPMVLELEFYKRRH